MHLEGCCPALGVTAGITMSFGSDVTVPFAGAARISMTTRNGLHWLSVLMWVVICDLAPDATVADSAHTGAGVSASAMLPNRKIFMTPAVHVEVVRLLAC